MAPHNVYKAILRVCTWSGDQSSSLWCNYWAKFLLIVQSLSEIWLEAQLWGAMKYMALLGDYLSHSKRHRAQRSASTPLFSTPGPPPKLVRFHYATSTLISAQPHHFVFYI